jgi:hypothetical protein
MVLSYVDLRIICVQDSQFISICSWSCYDFTILNIFTCLNHRFYNFDCRMVYLFIVSTPFFLRSVKLVFLGQ